MYLTSDYCLMRSLCSSLLLHAWLMMRWCELLLSIELQHVCSQMYFFVSMVKDGGILLTDFMINHCFWVVLWWIFFFIKKSSVMMNGKLCLNCYYCSLWLQKREGERENKRISYSTKIDFVSLEEKFFSINLMNKRFNSGMLRVLSDHWLWFLSLESY